MPGEVLWTPPADARERSRLGDFLRFVERTRDLRFADYDALWRWSVTEIAEFWRAIWDYFEIDAETPPTQVVADAALPGARWFLGTRVNYAEHVLRMPGIADDEPVVLAWSQTRAPVTLTAAELREQVRLVRAGLRRLGVGTGHRVAAYAPNIPETYILMLAAASLGAVFSSCAPEFGPRSVVDRWQQIEPTVLFVVDGYQYGDKAVSRLDDVAQIRDALPSLTHVISLSYLDTEAPPPPGALPWAELTAATDEPMEFDRVPFDHPLYVLYSSGTTGLPKPIVHGHGGILVEHLKTLALQNDLGYGDRFFWFSTTGWMMWNLLASGPAVGAAIVLFDGNPAHPDLGALWRLASDSGMTYFGTSAPFLLACRKAGLVPREIADLSRLRGVGSTGAPLPPEGFRYVYESISSSALLHSISGGTDVCTAFVGSAPLVPVRVGEISCRYLGAAVAAFDPTGQPVVGELGELVITAPMPSMPVGFWNDPDGSRYREAYFDVYPGVWRHGDWITITEYGSCVITGRSDATLNRGGVRLGTSEFYSLVEGLDEVVDSLVVHLDDRAGGPGELLLFVVLADGLTLDNALRSRIAGALRTALSPRHVPDEIHQVRAVPRTLSAKKLEVPVKRILTGTPVEAAAARGALANPESLTAFEELAATRGNQ
ncbi:MAG TPA: acetoacetate--CoA ligase [Jiangellales bacterium]|nr:acetoacetate--CoA ligase [Jiangellales bacterium]